MTSVTRFAPSPTGRLHLGHAYSAWFAFDAARADGRFLLRIEDIDATRCRPEFEQGIYDDLAWLGFTWETPVRRESEHLREYKAALATLDAAGLVYPCFCTRAEIRAEIARAGAAPHGPDGPLYPGTCRALTADERARSLPFIPGRAAHSQRMNARAASRAALHSRCGSMWRKQKPVPDL
jgi:glutamyl-Q tRNA(Asp) synthetase